MNYPYILILLLSFSRLFAQTQPQNISSTSEWTIIPGHEAAKGPTIKIETYLLRYNLEIYERPDIFSRKLKTLKKGDTLAVNADGGTTSFSLAYYKGFEVHAFVLDGKLLSTGSKPLSELKYRNITDFPDEERKLAATAPSKPYIHPIDQLSDTVRFVGTAYGEIELGIGDEPPFSSFKKVNGPRRLALAWYSGGYMYVVADEGIEGFLKSSEVYITSDYERDYLILRGVRGKDKRLAIARAIAPSFAKEQKAYADSMKVVIEKYEKSQGVESRKGRSGKPSDNSYPSNYGYTPSTGAYIHTGPRGGRYYYNSKGNKVYLKR